MEALIAQVATVPTDMGQLVLAALAGGLVATVSRSIFQAWRQPAQLRHLKAETESVNVETALIANQVAVETIQKLSERLDMAEAQINQHRIELQEARQEIARLRRVMVANGIDPDAGFMTY